MYEVEVDPDGFWDKVNPQVLPTAGGMMWVPEHPFVDAEVLRRGYCLKEYDMRATADNFWAFADPQHGENLYVSNGIRDLTGLQIIMQRGYGYLMQNAERYWNREFVFRSGFDNIERKYASDLSDEGGRPSARSSTIWPPTSSTGSSRYDVGLRPRYLPCRPKESAPSGISTP